MHLNAFNEATGPGFCVFPTPSTVKLLNIFAFNVLFSVAKIVWNFYFRFNRCINFITVKLQSVLKNELFLILTLIKSWNLSHNFSHSASTDVVNKSRQTPDNTTDREIAIFEWIVIYVNLKLCIMWAKEVKKVVIINS